MESVSAGVSQKGHVQACFSSHTSTAAIQNNIQGLGLVAPSIQVVLKSPCI